MAYDDIVKRFTSHPVDEDQASAMSDVRTSLRAVALHIDRTCKDGREKSLALTKLEEAVFWANAAIARS